MNPSPENSKSNHVWTQPVEDILERLNVQRESGLDAAEVKNRLKQYGKNQLRETKRISALQILFNQFKNRVVGLLVLAAGVSLLFHGWLDAGAIGVVILVNAAIGFFTEIRAVRSMESLRRLGSVTTKVRRSGQLEQVPAEHLVPGDVVIFEGGDIVTADMRIVTASKLEADESMLTGESLPVGKSVDPVAKDVPIAERSNMLFKGTALTRGSGEAVITSTGMDTELGRISSLVEEAEEEERTPLEKRLDKLAHKLIWVCLGIAVVVAVSGFFTGKELFLMIETGIALAIASIPEGLPIVATIALARGMMRMARRNALVNRLSAVETLGATNVIFTDKTGTLTENRMTVTQLSLPSGLVEVKGEDEEKSAFFYESNPVTMEDFPLLEDILKAVILCNNASLTEGGEDEQDKAVGDPMELALLVAGDKAGMDKDALVRKMPEDYEEAFDSNTKMMATYNRIDGKYLVSVKGAPEVVLQHCTHFKTAQGEKEMDEESRSQWMEQNNRMAEQGLRLLAVASKEVDSTEAKPYRDLAFLGLVGLLDPPREEVKEAITKCRNAGIRIVVVTGDQLITARNVALMVNLIDDENEAVMPGKELKDFKKLSPDEKRRLREVKLFARVSPEQKLDLIALHQETGAVVAMTGDGVNDAPALKKADIGVAMGRRGTQVAREASDMILKDDSFGTIALAVEQGRIIFNNIRKFIFYLLSCNVSEVMIIFTASLIFRKLPILPLQILFLNFVTDVFPALALGVGEGDPAVMKKSPRDPAEPLLTFTHWKGIFRYGMLITASVLGAFLIATRTGYFEAEKGVTIAFLTLALSQIAHVFNMREKGSHFIKNEITKNSFVWGAVALCVALLLLAMYLPVVSDVLHVVPLAGLDWLLVIGMSLVPFILGQASKEVQS